MYLRLVKQIYLLFSLRFIHQKCESTVTSHKSHRVYIHITRPNASTLLQAHGLFNETKCTSCLRWLAIVLNFQLFGFHHCQYKQGTLLHYSSVNETNLENYIVYATSSSVIEVNDLEIVRSIGRSTFCSIT